jgi:hypothetical protein
MSPRNERSRHLNGLSHAVGASVEDVAMLVALRVAGGLGEGRHVLPGEEAVMAQAALHGLGEQRGVGRTARKDLGQVGLVASFPHQSARMGCLLNCCSVSTTTSRFYCPLLPPSAIVVHAPAEIAHEILGRHLHLCQGIEVAGGVVGGEHQDGKELVVIHRRLTCDVGGGIHLGDALEAQVSLGNHRQIFEDGVLPPSLPPAPSWPGGRFPGSCPPARAPGGGWRRR